MPPPAIAAVLNFIPTNLWGMLKKFVQTEKVITFDIPFKMSTKYTPALFVVMMCLSLGNQFLRSIEMNCTSTDIPAGKKNSYGDSSDAPNADLNDFCWNQGTFIVAKALEPSMRSKVTYPGIWSYHRGEDELIWQSYYNYLWFGIGKLAVLSFLPLFLWKFRGKAKMKPLLNVGKCSTDEEQDEVRVAYFVETLGFNNGFGYYYMTCKTLATLVPVVIWLYLRGYIGKHYSTYGIDVIRHTMDAGDPWPNPMDALFPKTAKCEWARYGFTGDLELKVAQCQLPMNNLSQWTFFLLWIWLLIVFIINILSLLYFVTMLVIPIYRQHTYRRFVAKVCIDQVKMVRNSLMTFRGNTEMKIQSLKDIVLVNISFGDWFVLYLLKKNLQDFQFRSLIRQMALTSNSALQLQLRPFPRLRAEALNLPAAPPAEDGEENKTEKIQLEFMGNLLDGSLPPAYVTLDEEEKATPGASGSTSPCRKMGFGFENLNSSTPLASVQIRETRKIQRSQPAESCTEREAKPAKPCSAESINFNLNLDEEWN